jgi:transposase
MRKNANGMAGRAPALQDVRSCGGIKKHKEHVPCHTNPHHPPSARSASILVRIASILSVPINAGRLFGNSNARALERRLANIPCCLIGMEACCGAHYIARQLAALGHDVRLLPAQYVKPFLKGHKNDYRAMPRRLRKPCSGQPCTSWRDRFDPRAAADDERARCNRLHGRSEPVRLARLLGRPL